MKKITISLERIKNGIKANYNIGSVTHDLALYLMLKHKLFRTFDNVIYSFKDNTLKYVNLRNLINEEIAPVQANTKLIEEVSSYLTYIGNQSDLMKYFLVADGERNIDSICGKTYSNITKIILYEVQRLQDLEDKVTIR